MSENQNGLFSKPLCGVVLGLLAAVAPMSAAHAGLGSSAQSVASDSAHLRASLRKVTLATHIRHELTLPNGGAVHEFANSQGQIFAVTWRGPGKPDLRQLLGPHFADLQAASTQLAAHGARFRRIPVAISRDDLKIQTGGHMGYFWGVAYLPALLPPGFNLNDLQ